MEIKKYEIDEQFRSKIEEEIPQKLIRTLQKGKKSFNYISGYTVIKILNNITNYMWNWKIKEHWIEQSPPTSDGKITTVCHVIGILEARFVDKDGKEVTIVKEGSGSKICLGGNDQENVLKSASTDALKKAASYLGVAAALYLKEEEFDLLNKMGTELIWTKEMKDKYKIQWDYIEKFKKMFGVNNAVLNDLVMEWSDNTLLDINCIEPNNLNDFIDTLKKLEEQHTGNKEK